MIEILAKRAKRIESKLPEDTRGAISLLVVFDIVMSLLKACPKPVVPTPVNPTPNPTPVQSAAWEDAHKLKQKAIEARRDNGTFGGKGFNGSVAELMKKSRRDGEKIRRKEAVESVSASFEDAISSSMPDLYGDVMEFNAR